MAGSAPRQLVAVEPRAVDPVQAAPATRLPVELPRERRPGWPSLAALALACGLVAIALGGWAIAASLRHDDPQAAGLDSGQLDAAVSILADPAAERVPLRGSVGRLVLVAADDRALLLVDGLGRAPAGRAYAAWVIPPGSATPFAAATFDGSQRLVPLARAVPPGARVGVTLEDAGGVERPTRPLRLVAERGA